MPKLLIDGQAIEVSQGTTILQACEQLGIEIPTLCYIKQLVPSGACRMCLVEVKGARTLQVACAVQCTEGMEVTTMNDRVYAARRLMLELMLSHHNKDCFSCPANGECKLSNYCLQYGIEESRFSNIEKHPAPKDCTSEFFNYDPSKCILCRRCVRTCQERQCNNTLAVQFRGYNTIVTIPFKTTFKESTCVSCGNCVSACPTGALTAKQPEPFRAWEVTKTRTTCAYCGVGCQINLLVKNGKVIGVEPADGPSNQNLLCVKGKFAYNFINHSARLKKPLIRKEKGAELTEVEWDEALDFMVSKMTAIKAESGGSAFAGFSSARCTNEDNYLFMKMMRTVLGSNSVDHCARL